MRGLLQSRPQPGSATPGASVVKGGSTEAPRILAIEDDGAVQKILKRLFETEGYTVDLAKDGVSGLQSFWKRSPSAIILDLRLPDISGQEVCQQIARVAPGLPVIVLSAKAEVADKVVLLGMGACDYVTKPFSPRELLARVHVALRRSAQVCAEDVFAFDDVSVNFSKMELMRGGHPISLTCREFRILQFLIQNPERAISRQELLSKVWGYQNYPHTRTVDNHLLKLRQKLERDPSDPVHFITVHSFGYKFVR